MSTEQVQITISGVIDLINQGYSRTVGGTGYTEGKSIQEHFGLKKADVTSLFKHPKLKGLKFKVSKVPAFTLIDDTVETVVAKVVPQEPAVNDTNHLEAKLATNDLHSEGIEVDEDGFAIQADTTVWN